MSVQVICAPSWGYTYVRNDVSPDKLGMQLLQLVKRDGPDDVSDILDSHKDWDFISSEAKGIAGDPMVEPGYGKVMPSDADEDETEQRWAYGLLTDGTIMITDLSTNHRVAFHPSWADLEEHLEVFCRECNG